MEPEPIFRVTDLKQWVYCPRILYYHYCLPDVRPTTYKMKAGVKAGRKEEDRSKRRSLRLYGIQEGRKAYDHRLSSPSLGLRGKVDMVIWRWNEEDTEVIPVDYKLSRRLGKHFKLQIVAYGAMLEEEECIPSCRGFLYSIPKREVLEVPFTAKLKNELQESLDLMKTMHRSERIPAPTPHRKKCVNCEFRRYCNDTV